MLSSEILLSILGGFFLGSIPNGFLLAKTRGIDIREHGSKNIGATNVLRVLGKGPGYTVFGLDAIKGIAAVFAGGFLTHFSPNHLGEIFGGVACLLGHSYTPWLNFKGGKGVATTAGILIALFPLVFPIVLGVWAIIFYTTRYVSLASLIAAVSIPLCVWLLIVRQKPEAFSMFIFSCLICLVVVVRHKTNIQRLCQGNEPRFSKKK